jgi:hypothetical protein
LEAARRVRAVDERGGLGLGRAQAIQLYEMVLVRHGLMLVGESFGPKTSTYRVLAGALSATGTATVYHVINPKAVAIGQLYGPTLAIRWSPLGSNRPLVCNAVGYRVLFSLPAGLLGAVGRRWSQSTSSEPNAFDASLGTT